MTNRDVLGSVLKWSESDMLNLPSQISKIGLDRFGCGERI
jgi:hypothetical protein